MAKTQWSVGTRLKYTTDTSEVWLGEIMEVDHEWRRVRWDDTTLASWFRIGRLDDRAKRIPKPRAKKEASNEPQ